MSTDTPEGTGGRLPRLARAAQYRPPLLLVAGWGALTGVALSQAVVDPEPPAVQVFEIGVPLLLLLPIGYAVRYVGGSERATERQSRILLVASLFAVIGAGVVFLTYLSALADGVRFHELLFPILTGAATGASVGSLAGVNYDQVRETRAELEAELRRGRRLNQRLTVVNRVLRHNVRNTLALVFGLLDQVLDGADDTEDTARLRRARSALETLHSNTENALHVEHLWDRETETVLTDLEPMLATACERVREEAPAATIDVSAPSSVRVRAHPLLPVALEEILENAVEHNDAEALTVEVVVTRDNEWATITVADDGNGIPESEIESLGLDEETPLQHTSGVGLWVIKWVAEASDGDWAIRSTDDGTTVELRIPRE
ncbi:sensor histidine kinase [Halobellus rubicundus]|uniref:histidine kinase n=1 Tax=Halobellus rubicundus TaxID=2996466 RepID=A0ABD5MIQ9_9EURY